MTGLTNRAAYLRSYMAHVKNWWDIVLDRFGMKKGDYVLHFRNGLKCWAQAGHHDYGVLVDIIAGDSYFPAIPGFDISSGDRVVDIGANTGIFSLVAAQKGGKVIAFEPSERNYGMLARNAALNKLPGTITPVKKAVADKKGTLKLFIGSHDTTHSIIQNLFGDSGAYESVETTALDLIFEEHALERIDFLKIDCEGAEYAILRSASPKTLQAIKRISMEYHEFDGNTGAGLAEFLKGQGFQVDFRSTAATLGYLFAWRSA